MRQRDNNRQETERDRDRVNKRAVERHAWRADCVPFLGPLGPTPRPSLYPISGGISSLLLVPEVTPRGKIRSRTKEVVSWQTFYAMVFVVAAVKLHD